MNGQPIPGYFWDAEKKKYFRIQNQTASQGSHPKYSSANIKKAEKKERIQNIAISRSNKVRKERVVRRNPNSFAQTNLEREVGLRRRSHYVHGLWPAACAAGINSDSQEVLEMRRSHHGNMRFFDRDPDTHTIYAVHKSNSVCRLQAHRVNVEGNHNTSSLKDVYSHYPWDEVTRTTSTVSSLSFLPQTGALAVTTYGSDRPPELWLSDPERDQPVSHISLRATLESTLRSGEVWFCVQLVENQRLSSHADFKLLQYVGQKFTPKDCSAIWGAAARPSTFTPSPSLANTVAATWSEHLAVAASRSMLLFTRSQAGVWDSQTAVKSLASDVLALEWFSYTTVALGCRDGTIRLYDTRSGGSSHVLTHPSPVSKLRRADDETRLICSGLQDTLFLYDIRSPRLSRNSSRKAFNYNNHHYNEEYFEPIYPTRRDGPKRRKLNHKAFKNWSQPVLMFEHANRDELDLDLDIHPRLGLLAAAQDQSAGTAIRISNIWTGKLVQELKPDSVQSDKTLTHEPIRSLKFIDRDDDGDGEADLWSCWNGGIARFGW